jgi:RimJ/RimL family protein N-acetyltransferase
MKGVFLKGPRLSLRGLRVKDADGDYPNWLNDAEVCAGNSHGEYPYSRQAARDYIRESAASPLDLVLAMVLTEGERHIGNIALQHIHGINRSAEFAILIGDKSAWGQGYGNEAGRLLCAHGFAVLNLHRIYCGTYAHNIGMMHLAEKLGMRLEGLQRQAAYKNGSYVDVVLYGLLSSEAEFL